MARAIRTWLLRHARRRRGDRHRALAALLAPGALDLPNNAQIAGRTSPGLIDLVAALATGRQAILDLTHDVAEARGADSDEVVHARSEVARLRIAAGTAATLP